MSLISVFLELRESSLPFNLLLAVTAEEEVGGENGMRAFLPMLAGRGIKVDCAIVGEPTGMQPAVGERGLVVLDCVTPGVTGHAARGEGINAIYRAMEDIELLRTYEFPSVSQVLGPVSLNVTQINAGWQHNAIPDECRWVTDIRTTDAQSNEEVVSLLRSRVRWSTSPAVYQGARLGDRREPSARADSHWPRADPVCVAHHERHVAYARLSVAEDRPRTVVAQPLGRRIYLPQ